MTNSPVITPSLETASSPTIDSTDFSINPASYTIVQLVDDHVDGLSFWHPLVVLPKETLSDRAIEAMYQLVAVIQRLRSPEDLWPSDRPFTAETVFPYVADEAAEVLEALTSTPCVSPPAPPTDPVPLLLINDLTPRLLWQVARSSYRLMNLLGGMTVRVLQPGQDRWENGILRLMIILRAETEGEVKWCLDLATGQPPQPQLVRTAIVQLSGLSHVTIGPELPKADSFLLDNLLQALYQDLHTDPSLQALVDKLTIRWLEPEQNWQQGTLQLRLDCELITIASEDPVEFSSFSPPIPSPSLADLSQADSLEEPETIFLAEEAQDQEDEDGDEETILLTEPGYPAPRTTESPVAPSLSRSPDLGVDSSMGETDLNPEEMPTLTAVSLFTDMPLGDLEDPPSADPETNASPASDWDSSLSEWVGTVSITLMRFARDPVSQLYWAVYQGLMESLPQLPQGHSGECLQTLVDWAWKLASQPELSQTTIPALFLPKLQSTPQLNDAQGIVVAVEALLPQLFWQITRSSYSVARLVGGAQANLLEPYQPWQGGMVRLVTFLQGGSPLWQIDLATRQLNHVEEIYLGDDAIIQLLEPEWQSYPVPAPQFLAQLQAQISTTSPELVPWFEGMVVDWNWPEPGWQPITIQLQLALEFVPS